MQLTVIYAVIEIYSVISVSPTNQPEHLIDSKYSGTYLTKSQPAGISVIAPS